MTWLILSYFLCSKSNLMIKIFDFFEENLDRTILYKTTFF